MAIEHKPLIDYLPPFLAEYREYKRLFSVLWGEISENQNSILNRIEELKNNAFISLTNLQGIQHWERMLEIIPNAGATLEDRRELVKTRMFGDRPYTYEKLCELLDKLLGPGQHHIEIEGYTITVLIELTVKNQFAAVAAMLEKIVPANMICVVGLRYRQNDDLTEYIHNELKKYKHIALREEVLDE